MAAEKINKATHKQVIVVNPDTNEQEIRFQKKALREIPTSKKTEGMTTKKAKGGRITLRGGGICKRGMNKKARGKNS